MIKISCVRCEWWDNRTSKSVPYFCPECCGKVERATDAENPEQTKTDQL